MLNEISSCQSAIGKS